MADERMTEKQVGDFLSAVPLGASILVECDVPNAGKKPLRIGNKIPALEGGLCEIRGDPDDSFLRRENLRKPWMLRTATEAFKINWVGVEVLTQDQITDMLENMPIQKPFGIICTDLSGAHNLKIMSMAEKLHKHGELIRVKVGSECLIFRRDPESPWTMGIDVPGIARKFSDIARVE